jgi:hypothetical protein
MYGYRGQRDTTTSCFAGVASTNKCMKPGRSSIKVRSRQTNPTACRFSHSRGTLRRSDRSQPMLKEELAFHFRGGYIVNTPHPKKESVGCYLLAARVFPFSVLGKMVFNSQRAQPISRRFTFHFG